MKMRTNPYATFLLLLLLFASCSKEAYDPASGFTKFYGSYQADAGTDIQVLPDDGYVMTGSINPDSLPRMFLMATDREGNQKEYSPKFYGEGYQTWGHSILMLEDGYLLCGSLMDTLPDFQLHYDAFLVRTDT